MPFYHGDYLSFLKISFSPFLIKNILIYFPGLALSRQHVGVVAVVVGHVALLLLRVHRRRRQEETQNYLDGESSHPDWSKAQPSI